jgi:uncharacterized protein (TIGR03435 family)
MRAIVSAILIFLTSDEAFGQSTAAPPAYVASVKPNKSGSGSSSENERNGRLTATNISLKDCLRFAYGLKDYQIIGPDWINSEKYDIAAKAESSVTGEQLKAMFQALLADRFKLTVHRETKELPIYALFVGRNGPKLVGVEAGGSQTRSERGRLAARKISMPRLAEDLGRHLDRPVVDMTGLKGVFDLTLEWAPDESQTMPNRGGGEGQVIADSTAGLSIFTAVQQQLGLKLEARKGSAEILVIDHAEKIPTEN